jgi:hypothetical protein
LGFDLTHRFAPQTKTPDALNLNQEMAEKRIGRGAGTLSACTEARGNVRAKANANARATESQWDTESLRDCTEKRGNGAE